MGCEQGGIGRHDRRPWGGRCCDIVDVALTRHLIVKIIGIFANEMLCQSDIAESGNRGTSGRNMGVTDDAHFAVAPVTTHQRSVQIISMRISSSQKNIKFISHVYSYRILIPISQVELAKEVGIGRQALAAIEKGSAQPSLFTAFRIAESLRVKIEDLFTFTA